jgi:toxin ParE1/3/4
MKQTVEEAVDALRRFPDLGRPSRVRDVRELVINGTPYILVYRRMEKQVAILRLFHVAQKR